MKSAPLPTGTSQLEVKVTLRHRRQPNDTFSLTYDVETSATAKEHYLRWIKLIGDRHTTASKVRLVCEERQCGWCGPESDALRAPDPFNQGDTLIACPKCREQTLHTCCDEPTCTMEATCGTPTPNGYTHTCGAHKPRTEN